MNTLVTTYYENPELFEIFIENNFNQDYFSNLIVVDDASSKYPAKDILQHYDTSNISLFVLTEDVGFNGHAARNLAAYQTKTKWIT
ncbi:glycosyltransferase, partial [uncultured Planktosalinus sp.]|uniref:glycosyltransferase family 2 protein n=1 Tax=uncultured Planktosalinus sp. TaxID=1810935 RepID=UPI0030D9C34C